MNTKTYRLSPMFCNDHWSRDCGETDRIVKESKYCVYVELDAAGYADMLTDADLYSDHTHFDPPAEFYNLAQSAKRVAAVLRKEGPPAGASGTPTPTGTKRSRFGWCQFGPDVAHQACRVEFTDTYGQHHACSCECHGDPGAAA